MLISLGGGEQTNWLLRRRRQTGNADPKRMLQAARCDVFIGHRSGTGFPLVAEYSQGLAHFLGDMKPGSQPAAHLHQSALQFKGIVSGQHQLDELASDIVGLLPLRLTESVDFAALETVMPAWREAAFEEPVRFPAFDGGCSNPQKPGHLWRCQQLRHFKIIPFDLFDF
jgi:hypothetical protein